MSEGTNCTDLVARQRVYFNSGATRPVAFRRVQLDKLARVIRDNEQAILGALHEDLGKTDFEAFTTEILLVLEEIALMKKKVARWARPKRTSAGLFNFPARALEFRDPHGVCLIMSPWNYPFQLTLMPLIGAIAAGNTAVVKPSAYSQSTTALVAKLLTAAFPPEYIAVVEGGRAVNQDLLKQHFDYIFFTGSVEVGKLVMESASRFLTPVTLELGGKSPCIIDKSADVALAAKRTVWGKCINSGQTCVAPDYILVHESVKDAFIAEAQNSIMRFYGPTPHLNPEFPNIVNRHHFDRLSALIAGAEAANPNVKLVSGGTADPALRKIAPAILDGVSWDDPVMQEELFGPIIPILTWTDEEEIIRKILSRPRPLALYLFTGDKAQQKRILRRIPFGGGCINDTIMHVATHTLPFGGTGESGMGGYHGKSTFDAFSRIKSVVDKSTRIDIPLRYAPFAGKYRAFRKFL
ncbi:MAG: aldehyde dehydrogenase [Treponema sp.]|nr:MAG: aldehyde dehydrogenase [Treponema sp.]